MRVNIMSEPIENIHVNLCAQARVDIKIMMSGAGKYYEWTPCMQLTLMTIDKNIIGLQRFQL